MTTLYRTVELRGHPMPRLDLEPTCEYCHRHRAHGSHKACSKKRQAKYARQQ